METATERPRSTPPTIQLRRATSTSVYDLTLAELTAWMTERGYPAYRARQLFDALYKQLVTSYDEVTALPKALRADLTDSLPITAMVPVNEVSTQNRDTIKTLYRTQLGDLVETVLMLYPSGRPSASPVRSAARSVAPSARPGSMGLARNLTTGEMVAQVIDAARTARRCRAAADQSRHDGDGRAVPQLPGHDEIPDPAQRSRTGFGMGARRMTISTSGVVPFIDKLADEPLQVNLAISLHAPNDELRSQLVPINRKHPIADLMAAVDHYTAKTDRRVSFEYALMGGINDSDEIALELARLLKGRLCHVNVIPFNPVEVLPFERPTPERIERFAQLAAVAGIPATVRYSRGVDISAACGQLATDHQS